MDTTWILIADRAGARLFEQKGRGKPLTMLQDLPHPEGRLKNQDIDADKHGRAFDSMGQGRHAMSTEQAPTDRVAQRFAKELAQRLDQGRTQNAYSRLILVAEPAFLGTLRAALPEPLNAKVTATVNKNLTHVKERDLPDHLGDALQV
jgi:protein required for attachment to host cells